MSDRSDEITESRNGDPPATDDLLEETDRLLSESGTSGDAARSDASPGQGSDPEFDPERDAALESDGASAGDADAGTGSSRLSPSSWLSPLTSRLSLGRYFSPKAYFALVLVLGAGLLAGATALPFGGRLVGMFATAFVVGLLASKRRYLEIATAGVSVGGVAAVLNYTVLAVAGSGQAVVAVGATVGLLASVVGYYFGRDLRDGLSRDVD
ncbi:hypothetical protein [Natrinema salaciae]|uniref:DUF456 domain-containing protein n=1 Tax=Natrinema salaciae TaxID=1186196 RepID=A0A1H9RCQ7_9EURY|nr:hypothetical protein [Natrinema salaciae]SER70536.1 hypothetical protein SAMN04489841_4352 [Natrinema salaciae]